jgi:hypothetical protein
VYALPRQGAPFRLERVVFGFALVLPITKTFYFWVEHRDGAGNRVNKVATTNAEKNLSNGTVVFQKGDIEFRSHEDGYDSQLMSAPLGCEGWDIRANDTVQIVLVSDDGSGTDNDMTVEEIFWHLVFEGKDD